MRDDIDTRLLDHWLTDREQTDAIPPIPFRDAIRSVLRAYWLPVDVREHYVALLYELFARYWEAFEKLSDDAWYKQIEEKDKVIEDLRKQVLLEEDIREETREWAKETLRNRGTWWSDIDKL